MANERSALMFLREPPEALVPTQRVVAFARLHVRDAVRVDDARGVAFLYLGESSGVLLLVRQGILYLTRHIETGVNSLRDSDGMRSELVAGLALETRRSLDYFESHYE